MLALLFTALLITSAQIATMLLWGYGATRLLLPEPWWALRWFLAPLFGYSLLALIAFYGLNSGATLRSVALVGGASAALIALLSLRRSAPPQVAHLAPGEAIALLGFAAGTWLLSLWPTLSYGAFAPSGVNYDVEFYLPLAEYLKETSYRHLADVAANPLLSSIIIEPTISRAMGFSYLQGSADLLGGWSSWQSFTPMLATSRALTVVALFALLRYGLELPASAALGGALLAGLNSLLLWTSYNSFAMGLGGLTLLPIALLFTIRALERWEIRSMAGAMILLSGLICTYWPMLMAYGAAGLGIGIALLWAARHANWLAICGRASLLLGLSGLLTLLVHLRAPRNFLANFVDYVPTSQDFLPAPALFGTLAYPPDHPFPSGVIATPPEVWLGWIGFAVALIALGYGIRRSPRWMLAGALALGIAAYLLGLRWVVGFPYGYLRGAAYSNSLLVGLIGAGLGGLWHQPHLPRRILGAIAVLLITLSSGLASYRTAVAFGGERGLLAADAVAVIPQLEALTIPGPVGFSAAASTRLCRIDLLPWSYGLRERSLIGSFRSGYGGMSRPSDGQQLAYLALLPNEDPRSFGFVTSPVLSTTQVALYPAPPAQQAWFDGATRFANAPLCGSAVSLLERERQTAEEYLQATPSQPLTLYANQHQIGQVPRDGSPSSVSLRLLVGSWHAQRLTIELDQATIMRDVPAGLSSLELGSINVPSAITINPERGPLLVETVQLGNTAATWPLARRGIVLAAETRLEAEQLLVTLQVGGTTQEALRIGVELYEDVIGYRDIPRTFAQTLAPLAEDGQFQLRYELASGRLWIDDRVIEGHQFAERTDEAAIAALWLYQGEQRIATLPLLHLPADPAAPPQLFSYSGVPIGVADPEVAQMLQFGEMLQLHGFSLVQDADQIAIDLDWSSLSPGTKPWFISLQLLDASDSKIAQWDGPLGGEWRPYPEWQAMQRLRQHVPLPFTAAPSRDLYRLVLIVYDPQSGTRLRHTEGELATLATISLAERSIP